MVPDYTSYATVWLPNTRESSTHSGSALLNWSEYAVFSPNENRHYLQLKHCHLQILTYTDSVSPQFYSQVYTIYIRTSLALNSETLTFSAETTDLLHQQADFMLHVHRHCKTEMDNVK